MGLRADMMNQAIEQRLAGQPQAQEVPQGFEQEIPPEMLAQALPQVQQLSPELEEALLKEQAKAAIARIRDSQLQREIQALIRERTGELEGELSSLSEGGKRPGRQAKRTSSNVGIDNQLGGASLEEALQRRILGLA